MPKCLNNNDNSKKHNNFLRFFPWWKRFLCGPQLFVKLRSQQSKQSYDSFFLVSRLADKTRRTRVKGKLAVSRLSRGLRTIFLLIYWSLPIKGLFNTQAPSVTSWSSNFWFFRTDLVLSVRSTYGRSDRSYGRNSNMSILLRFSKNWQGK